MSFPDDFIRQMRVILSKEDYDKFIEALQLPAPVSIRFNPWKVDDSLLPAFLHSYPDKKIPWCSSGYYLKQRLTFTFDPLFHAGCYYVQEAASMFLEQAIKQYVQKPVVMLDLCAAPGGKSTHVQSVLPKGSLLVANEIIRSRSHILDENLIKWGCPDVVVTNNDPADFTALTGFFDVILVDAPCSGEGMFRKDTKTIKEWRLENVELCRRRQQRILSDSWSCLKPDGILIYSTCTYNTKENEENVQWMQQKFDAEILPVDISKDWNITGGLTKHTFTVYRFLPYKTEGEGFFLAVLRKPFDSINRRNEYLLHPKRNKRKTNIPASSKTFLSVAKEWLLPNEDYQLSFKEASITVFPKVYENEWSLLEQYLHIVRSGTMVGDRKGKDLIPHHSLAMSRLLRWDAFLTEDVDYEQALAYLQKKTILLKNNFVSKYILMIYKNIPLGFVKHIGNRVNNFYPLEWRIRSSHLPEEIRTV
ncbi:Ribosomal RNA small subunit methyltransferase F [termite gut metagenome]|uniref:Ribosomal RNA small subunit methyltransferase F n=1 Tax=termite gut metagenome TaxID=433724 RepID=A0A5J4QHA8_9ZZZZ